ncbi:hypothetical protein B0H10DRAFT_2214638 [Mycena sp. CBHHK59/15]|nr:hypothetical protein B0H10DRAFT_2214638 [Mycena sp. CBHHK59/15]
MLVPHRNHRESTLEREGLRLLVPHIDSSWIWLSSQTTDQKSAARAFSSRSRQREGCAGDFEPVVGPGDTLFSSDRSGRWGLRPGENIPQEHPVACSRASASPCAGSARTLPFHRGGLFTRHSINATPLVDSPGTTSGAGAACALHATSAVGCGARGDTEAHGRRRVDLPLRAFCGTRRPEQIFFLDKCV